ncbi:MAG: ATP-binding protein [Candidatus Cloacimonadia bacterium]
MKEIVIISGKGGTGKTSVAAALATLVKNQAVVADCDVDAPDLHLVLSPTIKKREDFYSGVKAVIHTDKCTHCNLCKEKCRFDAIEIVEGKYRVIPLECEGCGYCSYICPVETIELVDEKVGECYISETHYGSPMVHSQLGIGADNSGKLVAKVKKEAKQLATEKGIEYVIVDGSPGIGCPVIASLSGADYVVFVTEPTLSGLSDLKRVWELTNKFQIPAGCIINKADLNQEVNNSIEEFLQVEGIDRLATINYDTDFQSAITSGISLIEHDRTKWGKVFSEIWNKIN